MTAGQVATTAALSNATDVMKGWQGQPNPRGTFDIIRACLLVIFTGVWTVLHINIPATSDGYWAVVFRKLRWAALAAFAPEMLTLIAACQRSASMASAKYLQSQGFAHWTDVHSFYAESGGFYLHVPEEPGYPPCPPFPLNSRAIAYLVERGYIEMPSITLKDIDDKSKADKFAKIFAVVQSSYLILESIARRVQSLAITPLELTTLAFVPCTLATYYMWMNKLLGVNTSTPIYTTTPISQILKDAGPLANEQWCDTPLDFVEDHTLLMTPDPTKPPPPALLKGGRLMGWNFWKRRSRFAHIGSLTTRPISRIPNDYTVAPSSYRVAISIWAFSTFHAVVHLLGWNFVFPTRIELWMWRVAALTMTGTLGVGGLGNVRAVRPGVNFRIQMLGVWVKPAFKEGKLWKYGMDVPGTAGAIMFFVAKIWILALSWASLRTLPKTAYDTVSWTRFIPHV